ncbi:metallophosphoesterase [Candidatus Woesearchaeota archaeon]|nr:metallophosphoesterase [Candidatus Woesearchaeota archaeon]
MTTLHDTEIIGPALLLNGKDLILSDLHLGAEATIVGNGVLLPRTQKDDTFKLIDDILERCRPERIILNGDIKHEFGTIQDEEWRDVLQLLDKLSRKARVDIVKGNHDTILLPILRKRGLEAKDSILIKGDLIIHGDREPTREELDQATRIITGHEHPSLMLDDGIRQERFKAFLTGTYKDRELIIMPSMYPLVEGSDVIKEPGLGPIMKEAEGLEAHAIEGFDTYPFGPLKNLNT